MELVGWRAYDRDGPTVDSSEVPTWREVPAPAVGVVEFLARPYRKLVSGGDYLWMEDGRWRASETVWGGWVDRPHPEAIRGAGLADEDWQRIHRRMMEDRRWP